MSSDQAIYLNSETYTIIDGVDEKTVTLSILVPGVDAYEITIGMRSNSNFSINTIIEIIIEE